MGIRSRTSIRRLAAPFAALAVAAAAFTASAPAHATPPGGWGNRHLDEVTLIGAHNAEANCSDGVCAAGHANQHYSFVDQMQNHGVRMATLELDNTAGDGIVHTTPTTAC